MHRNQSNSVSNVMKTYNSKQMVCVVGNSDKQSHKSTDPSTQWVRENDWGASGVLQLAWAACGEISRSKK